MISLLIIYYTYQMTHSVFTVFFTLIGMILIVAQLDIAEIENTFDDIFDDFNEFQINQTEHVNTSSTNENKPIIFDTNLLYVFFLPWIMLFLLLFVIKPIYKYEQRRVKKPKKSLSWKQAYTKSYIEKHRKKTQSRGIISPPSEIGDYILIENISDSEIENVKKQYQQIGHWVQVYNFHDSKQLYISKWTKHEKDIYGKPKWIKNA
ncbi:MAG: hypothetical protein ACOC56_02895 [Atribacterota bacterium]